MGRSTVGATPPRVLAVGGTDSGGGAGLAADMRTLVACGVHTSLAVTAVTAQNSVGVSEVFLVPAEMVAAQVEVVATDIGIDAVKTAMLATTAIIDMLAEVCQRFGIGGGGRIPLVVDPVAVSINGDKLLTDDALDAFRVRLFPRATLIAPNLEEVRLLVGVDVHDRAAQYEAAKLLHGLGPRYVLVKGGHLSEDIDVCVDVLYDGTTFIELTGPRFNTGNTHGGGESFGAAITAALARGMAMPSAVALAKKFTVEAVRHSYPLGAGHGPVSPLWTVRPWWEASSATAIVPPRATASTDLRQR